MTGVNNKFFAAMLANAENCFTFTHGYSPLCAFFLINWRPQEEYPFLWKKQEAKSLCMNFPGRISGQRIPCTPLSLKKRQKEDRRKSKKIKDKEEGGPKEKQKNQG